MGSLTLSQHGGIVYSHVNGFRQVSKTDSRPATLTTAYRIGSISKIFTSVMIFQLIEQSACAWKIRSAAGSPKY
ncbi:serine hydrolase [Mucilaginibacter sp. SJ]|uniref:serine hydrolase n=1 Tax=Mucilaginibacter sp. SJ TaxID=3029053 RepID=UPI00406CC727